MTVDHATFRALGGSVFVVVRDPAELTLAVRLARLVLDDVDEVCSRFRPDSDLCRVNARPGEWVTVDPLLVVAVKVALGAARATGGLVNPLLGRELVALGYDSDFRTLSASPDQPVASPADPPGPSALTAWEQVDLDPGGAVRTPVGTALDLGATGKAWAADLVATSYEEHLRASAVVSVAGDLRIAHPDGHPWPVAISEQPGAEPDTTVALDRGGMATSSTQVRRWVRGGVRRHHLIDPRTGGPAREVWRTVTATGATCAAANTASTAAIVLGRDAPGWLAAHDVTARLVGADGQVQTVGGWPAERRNAA